MPAPADLDELARRLAHADPKVRRVAVHDLARLATPGALRLLTDRLSVEDDEKTAIMIARHLGEACFVPARAVLARLCAAPQTNIRLYHACLLAHDRIERHA